ncbi:DUF4105 domain-containing protein [Nitratireductor mangrovi]|uniref:DUF4105 domain-containing protein n=1 Tax=Nitratireductor mangrovi TaxID=2599600 RepID=A0A5B8L0B3_9HYPH|nr:DUF4105 domain-containing protein [Nitratireductor mangrovi]QDZ01283.2 DUF4105 domain-containing protein [Nitratireductor mangrovi]
MRTVARNLAFLLIAFLVSACVTAAVIPPSHEREWEPSVSRLPTVRWISDDVFAMSNIRDWQWGEDGATRRRWHQRRYDLRDTRAIWFFVEPFPYGRSLAHTFITFELGRGARREFLTVSVEARKEVGETYSPVRGLFSAYELIFVWSTEKDILTDTIIRLGHEVRAYKVNVTPDQARIILRGFLRRTNEIAASPEYYDTLENNCTSELAAVVNREFDMPIPRHSSYVLTGTAARYLHSLGYIVDPSESYAEVDARADIGGPVRRFGHLGERRFSIAWRRVVEGR